MAHPYLCTQVYHWFFHPIYFLKLVEVPCWINKQVVMHGTPAELLERFGLMNLETYPSLGGKKSAHPWDTWSYAPNIYACLQCGKLKSKVEKLFRVSWCRHNSLQMRSLHRAEDTDATGGCFHAVHRGLRQACYAVVGSEGPLVETFISLAFISTLDLPLSMLQHLFVS
jgi:hypothetical protein